MMTQRAGARWWRDLDAILRRSSDSPTGIERSLQRLLLFTALCGGTYGSFVGWYAVKTHGWPGLLQILATAFKIPLLFHLTLAVTFPSLYLFAALLDSPLGFRQTLRLLLTAILVTLLAAAAFGPILGFFTVSTESYAFMVLLNVALLGGAGVIGMAYLVRRMQSAERPPEARPEQAPPPHETTEDSHEARTETAHEVTGPSADPGSPPRIAAWSRAQAARAAPARPPTWRPRGSTLLQAWIVIYALVGMQMAWILRPFLGAPDSRLTLFRPIGGNFFESLVHTLQRLVGL